MFSDTVVSWGALLRCSAPQPKEGETVGPVECSRRGEAAPHPQMTLDYQAPRCTWQCLEPHPPGEDGGAAGSVGKFTEAKRCRGGGSHRLGSGFLLGFHGLEEKS